METRLLEYPADPDPQPFQGKSMLAKISTPYKLGGGARSQGESESNKKHTSNMILE
jgi:hypothetical protein